jgi:hypothetical protein
MRQETVQFEIKGAQVVKLSAKDLAAWAKDVVPALMKGETRDSKYILQGIMTIMDGLSDMSEFIGSDKRLTDQFLEYHKALREVADEIH